MPKQIRAHPECVYGNKAHSVCINPSCRKPAFICEGGLNRREECAVFHEHCQKMEWTQMESIIHENPNTKNPDFEDLIEKM